MKFTENALFKHLWEKRHGQVLLSASYTLYSVAENVVELLAYLKEALNKEQHDLRTLLTEWDDLLKKLLLDASRNADKVLVALTELTMNDVKQDNKRWKLTVLNTIKSRLESARTDSTSLWNFLFHASRLDSEKYYEKVDLLETYVQTIVSDYIQGHRTTLDRRIKAAFKPTVEQFQNEMSIVYDKIKKLVKEHFRVEINPPNVSESVKIALEQSLTVDGKTAVREQKKTESVPEKRKHTVKKPKVVKKLCQEKIIHVSVEEETTVMTPHTFHERAFEIGPYVEAWEKTLDKEIIKVEQSLESQLNKCLEIIKNSIIKDTKEYIENFQWPLKLKNDSESKKRLSELFSNSIGFCQDVKQSTSEMKNQLRTLFLAIEKQSNLNNHSTTTSTSTDGTNKIPDAPPLPPNHAPRHYHRLRMPVRKNPNADTPEEVKKKKKKKLTFFKKTYFCF